MEIPTSYEKNEQLYSEVKNRIWFLLQEDSAHSYDIELKQLQQWLYKYLTGADLEIPPFNGIWELAHPNHPSGLWASDPAAECHKSQPSPCGSGLSPSSVFNWLHSSEWKDILKPLGDFTESYKRSARESELNELLWILREELSSNGWMFTSFEADARFRSTFMNEDDKSIQDAMVRLTSKPKGDALKELLEKQAIGMEDYYNSDEAKEWESAGLEDWK